MLRRGGRVDMPTDRDRLLFLEGSSCRLVSLKFLGYQPRTRPTCSKTQPVVNRAHQQHTNKLV